MKKISNKKGYVMGKAKRIKKLKKEKKLPVESLEDALDFLFGMEDQADFFIVNHPVLGRLDVTDMDESLRGFLQFIFPRI